MKAETALPDAGWEGMHAPYDGPTYQAVLDQLRPGDVILDIGAGDLRLARQMARVAQTVYAVERNAQLLDQSGRLPANLIVHCGDARSLEFPPGITAGVLLMRHCTCFRLYAEKLQQAGATRLITNARWRMNVEVLDLWLGRISFEEAPMGWYACWCGAVGFKEGAAEQWTFEMDRIVHEVSGCPQCM